MICIFFSTGCFGSTVEYVLRSSTNNYSTVISKILDDGSMHGYKKSNHLVTNSQFIDFFKNRENFPDDSIITPVYPNEDNTQLPEILSLIQTYVKTTDKFVLLYFNSIDYAEINFLFVYHKVINGEISKIDLDDFYVSIGVQKHVSKWNQSYQFVKDMKPWELREWLSLLDLQLLIDAQYQVDNRFLKISTEEILNNTIESFEKIIRWCGLTRNSTDLEKFATEWRQKQQYVLDEHDLIVNIVEATISNEYMEIPADLNIFAQAILQQRLRRAGYELRCDGLNNLPKDTKMLHSLLDSALVLHMEQQ